MNWPDKLRIALPTNKLHTTKKFNRDKRMKNIGFIFCFIICTTSAFGQQFLWSTVKDTTIKYVSLENVTDEVLEFYDHYEFYYDGAGFSKEGFFKMFEGSQSYKNSNTSQWKDFKKKIDKINDLTVFAFRSNSGKGSVILVLCVTKENVNLITFSNTYEADSQLTYSTDREKFAKWFKTLLD